MITRDATNVDFTDEEADFLAQIRLARIATVSPDQQPHVVPVAFEFDGRYFYFSGWNLRRSLKFRNIQRNNKVALVFDDLVSENPWRPRGIEIRGIAEIMGEEGQTYVRIIPRSKRSWGL